MRAELKVGIAVGLIIAVVAVVYIILHESPGKSPVVVPKAEPSPATAAPVGGDTLTPAFSGAGSSGGASALAPGLEPTAPSAHTTTGIGAEGPMALRIGPPTTQPAGSDAAGIAAKGTTTYVVKKGDKGYWDIAVKVYGPGKGRYWTLIDRANKDVGRTGLKEGMTLIIPPLEEPGASTPAAAPGASAGEKTYVVQANDGWWLISRKEYGDGRYWEEIRKANPQVGDVLKAGQKIKIPPLDQVRAARGESGTTTPPPTTKPAPAPASDRPVFD